MIEFEEEGITIPGRVDTNIEIRQRIGTKIVTRDGAIVLRSECNGTGYVAREGDVLRT